MELISQICKSNSPVPLVQQFVQSVYEHQDTIKESLRRLFNALRSKSPQHRGNAAYALFNLFKKVKSAIDPDEIYNFSNEVLFKPDSTTADNRRSNIALFFSWNSMCRSGLFRDRHDIVTMIIQNLHGFGNERLCYRTIAYEILWSVIDVTYKTIDEFKEEMFDNLVNEMGPTATPPHAESFALWLKIGKKFPGLPLKKWATSPVSSATCRSMASILEKTTSILPQVHPVWDVLSSIDPNQLIHNTMEIWGKAKKPDGYIPMIASISAFQYLEVQHFINILNRHSGYYSELASTKYGDLISNAILKAAEKYALIHKHRVVAICAAVLKCVNSQKLKRLLSLLSDADTRELLEMIKDDPFTEFIDLLWAQTRRENMEDSSLITEIFQKSLSKLESDEDRQKVIPFLSHCIDLTAPDGKHYFSLLSQETPISGIIITNQEMLSSHASSILQAAKNLHQILGLGDHEFPEITDLTSMVNASLQLLKSNCKFCQAIGRSFAQHLLQYIDDETLSKFENEPLVMIKALSYENLSPKAIPLLFKKLNLLPYKVLSRPEKVVLNISQEGIKEALPILIKIIRETKPKGFHVAIAQMLIDKLDDPGRNEMSEQVLNDQLGANLKSESDILNLFIRSSFSSANHILDLILERLKSDKTQAFIMRARGWFEEIVFQYDIPEDKIGNAICNFIDINYDDAKVSDRKKAEDALGWCIGFITENSNKNIPLDSLQPILSKYENSKSRKLSLMALSLKNPESVISNNE